MNSPVPEFHRSRNSWVPWGLVSWGVAKRAQTALLGLSGPRAGPHMEEEAVAAAATKTEGECQKLTRLPGKHGKEILLWRTTKLRF